MKKLKNIKVQKLSTKIGIFSGVIVMVCMMICNFIGISRFSNGLNEAVNTQFNQISEENILKINTVLEECEQIYDTIDYDLQNLFQLQDKMSASAAFNISKVTGKLTTDQKEAEDVILTVLWSSVDSNENLEAAGVCLEPYVFSKDIETYSPYVMKSDISERTLENSTYSDYGHKEYYTGAKDGYMSFMDAYYDKNGILMYSIGYPIMYKNEFKGIVLLDITSGLFSMFDTKNAAYPSMYIDLIGENRNIIYSAKNETIGSNLKDLMSDKGLKKLEEKFSMGESFHVTTSEADGKYIHYASPIQVGNETWWVKTTVSQKEYNAQVNRIGNLTMLTAVISVIIIMMLVMSMLRKVLNPLTDLEKAAVTMANGSLNVEISYDKQDEIGSLANSMRTMMERIRTIIGDLRYNLDEMANSNFALEMENSEIYVGDYHPIIVSLENIIKRLNDTLVNIKVASEQVDSGSDQVSNGAQALSQGATEQASTVEELSATMMTVSEDIREAAVKAEEANKVSEVMRNEVVKSNEKMTELSFAMQEITDKSNEIGKIIKAIEDIAFQTNILALNAAVEAARAGEAGKGFAVVADEVRNLAQKSADSAKNTTALIDATIQAVSNGGRITEETASALNVVADSVDKVADLVNNIAEAANDQAVQISQATDGLEQISAVVQTNSATAEESAAASEELSSQANMMNELISAFKLRDSSNNF